MLHPQGVSKFKILSIDEDGHALIESLLDSPGKYAFSVAVKFLVPATVLIVAVRGTIYSDNRDEQQVATHCPDR